MGGETSHEMVNYLRTDAGGRRELDELVQRFCEMLEQDDFKIPMVCFYETQRTDFTKVISNLSPEFVKHLNGDCSGIVSFHCTGM